LAIDTILDTEMPRKVRQLIADLEKAGFVNRGGKGSHRNFTHPKGLRVTISGGAGDDAKHYQERDVRRALDNGERINL
jgi:predicted RNA binding protein YcfA (HicA-like mRNA interferase family)